jgi:hypothetical protein
MAEVVARKRFALLWLKPVLSADAMALSQAISNGKEIYNSD